MKLIASPTQRGSRSTVVADLLRIGRSSECEVKVSSTNVSRTHARIVRDGEVFWLEDLNSSNGTFLNGERIRRERLAHLDVISLGQDVDFIVDVRGAGAPVEAIPSNVEVSLVYLDGPESGTSVAVPPGEFTIGRAAPASLLISNRLVSKFNTRLRLRGGDLTIEDLRSANGTMVNSRPIANVEPLRDGDRIDVGGVRAFQVKLAGSGGTNSTSRRTGGAHPPADATSRPMTSATPPTSPGTPRTDGAGSFNQEWKTRLVWSADELAAIEAERARIVEEVGRWAPGPPAPEHSGVERGTEMLGRMSVPPPPELPKPKTTTIRAVRLYGPAEFVLKIGTHDVGRDRGAVALNDRQVSRNHAKFTVSEQSVTLEDTGSANGTLLNGTTLSEPRALTTGDRVTFGGAELTVEVLFTD